MCKCHLNFSVDMTVHAVHAVHAERLIVDPGLLRAVTYTCSLAAEVPCEKLDGETERSI